MRVLNAVFHLSLSRIDGKLFVNQVWCKWMNPLVGQIHGNEREGVAILYGDVVQPSIVYASSETLVFFLYKEKSCPCWWGGWSNYPCLKWGLNVLLHNRRWPSAGVRQVCPICIGCRLGEPSQRMPLRMQLESLEQQKREGEAFPGVDILSVVPSNACQCVWPRRLMHPTPKVGVES